VLYIGFFNGPVGGTPLIVLYSIVPWIGVMAAGYAFGTILTLDLLDVTARACASDSAPSRSSWCCGDSTSTVIPTVERDDAAAGVPLIPQHDKYRRRSTFC